MSATSNDGILGQTLPIEAAEDDSRWTAVQIVYVSVGAILSLMAFAEILAFTGAVSYAFVKVHQKAKTWGERYLSLFIMLLWWLLRAVFLFSMLSLVPVPHYDNDALLPKGLRDASVYVAFSLVTFLLMVPTLISLQQLLTAPSNMKERLESIRGTASFPRVLIVMPVYNELPEVLHVAICSVIDGDYPKEHVHIFISFDNDAVSELYLALIANLGVPQSEHYPPVIDLYYRGVQITVSRFPHGGKRLTQKKTFALIGTIYKDYPEKTDHLFVLFIDSDILLHPATLGNFMWEMELKPGSRKDMLGMTGVITVTTKQNMSFIALLQDMEYVHGQFFGRAIESAVGGVICLPGALTMFRYSAFLKSSDEYFAEREASDLWDFGRSHLGEDRYLTHLLMAGAKRPKMIQFCHRATCKTEPVMEWRNLLKQRRRWFLGFITNESSLLSDPLMWRKYPFLLSFRMLQNIVFGTSMVAYLIAVAVLCGVQNMSWVWIGLLGVYFLTNWMLMLTYGIWLGRRKAWLYPILFIAGPFVSWFLLVYGVCTANERTWGGPRADASKAAEEGENHQPTEDGTVALEEERLKDDHEEDDDGMYFDHFGRNGKLWSRCDYFDDLTDDDVSQLGTDMGNRSDSESERPSSMVLPSRPQWTQRQSLLAHVAHVEDDADNEDAKTFRTAHEEIDPESNQSPRVSVEHKVSPLAIDETVRGHSSTLDRPPELLTYLNQGLSDDQNRSKPKLGEPAMLKHRDSTVSIESTDSTVSDASVSTSSSKSTTCESTLGGASAADECLVIHPLGLSSTPRVDKDSKWWLDSDQLGSLGIVPFTQRPKVPEAFASAETLILSPVVTESPLIRPRLEQRKSSSAVPRNCYNSIHEDLISSGIGRDRKPRTSMSYGNIKGKAFAARSLSIDFTSFSPRSSASFQGPNAAFSNPSANGSFVSLHIPPAALDNMSTGSPTFRPQRMSAIRQSSYSARGSSAASSSPIFQYVPSAYITPTNSAPGSPRLPPLSSPSISNSPYIFPATPSSLSLAGSPRDTPSPDGLESGSASPAISATVTTPRSGRSRVATAPGSVRSRSRSQSRGPSSLSVMSMDNGAGIRTPPFVPEGDAQRRSSKRPSKVQQQVPTGGSAGSSPFVSNGGGGSTSTTPSSSRTDRHQRRTSMSSSSTGYHGQEERHPPVSPSLSSTSSRKSRPRHASLDSSAIVTTAISFTKDGIVPPVPPLPRVIPVQAAVPNDILRAAVMVAKSINATRNGGSGPTTASRPPLTPRTSSLTVANKSKWVEGVGVPASTRGNATVISSWIKEQETVDQTTSSSSTAGAATSPSSTKSQP